MAKYTIVHTCTHTSEIELFGANAERGHRISQLERMACVACRAAANGSVMDDTGATLPALTGSDKQVAWALQIRKRALSDADRFMVAHTGDAERLAVWQTIRAYLVGQQRSSWWIERRDASTQALVNEARRTLYAVAAPASTPRSTAHLSTKELEDSLYGSRD